MVVELIYERAKREIDRMLNFAESSQINVNVNGDLADDQTLFQKVVLFRIHPY